MFKSWPLGTFSQILLNCRHLKVCLHRLPHSSCAVLCLQRIWGWWWWWGIAKSSFMMCPCLSPSSSLLPHVGEQWPRTFCILLNHRPLRVIKSRHVAESSRGVFKSQKTTLNLSDPKLPTLPVPACLLVKEHVRVPCMVVMRFCFDVVYIELGRASRNLTLEKPARGVEY